MGSVIVRGAGGGRGDDDSGCGDDDGSRYGIKLRNSRYITIRDLIITNVNGPAIWLAPSEDGGDDNGKATNVAIHIELNRIYGNMSSTCHGGVVVSAGNRQTLILNNLIYANGTNGIAFEGNGGGPHYVINNTIYGNRRNGINVARGQTVMIANNIVNGNGTASGTTGGRFGVRRESSSIPQPQNIRLLNNLVCGNAQGQISTQILDATDSSNFTPTGSEGAGVGALPTCQLQANLFANKNGPDNLANTADDDFSLKPNSLAIDTGMDPRTLGLNPSFNPIFEADFVVEGVRPADGNADRVPAFDAGAFEYSNAPPIANVGFNQTVYRSQVATLNSSLSSDPEGAPLRFLWTIVSQPAGSNITLTGATTANPTFTPLIIGDYILRLIVNDGQFNSAPATVTVTAINHPPTTNNVSATTNEDTSVSVTLSASDFDDANLSLNVVAAPGNGTLNNSSGTLPCSSGKCTGTVTYTPKTNFNGADSFTFTVSDSLATSNVSTVSITVSPGVDLPTASGATLSTDEDVPVVITLAASGMDSARLSFNIVAAPTNGTLSDISLPNCVANGAGSNCTVPLTYTPAANYNGPDKFTFKANDGALNSNVATVFLTVLPINDAPVASNGTAQTNEDNPIDITLRVIDIDSMSLTFNIITSPSNGSLSAIGAPSCVTGANNTGTPGTHCTVMVTYTPGSNFAGSDSLTFRANDGAVDSNAATISMVVNVINDAPVASADFYNTNEDTVLSTGAPGILGNDNDTDTPAANLSAVLVSAPSHAAYFTFNPDGSFSYTPAANYSGADTFTYKVNDGSTDSNQATVTIAVNSVNDAPVATNDVYNTDEDTSLDILARGVLANDNDIDTPQANLAAILVTGPTHAASFTLNPDGSFSYAPATNFNGADSFTYKANDGASDSNLAMVTIAVNPVNDAPVGDNDNYSVAEDSVLGIAARGVLENDSDLDVDQTLTVELVTGPTHATSFSLNGNGSFNYIPEADFNGVDTFTYRVFDGTLYSNVAMAQIAVVNVNDPSVAQSQSISTNQNTPVIVTLSASDIDHKVLTFNIAIPPSHGTLGNIGAPNCRVQGQGATCTAMVSYTPASNYFGADSFTLNASDGLGIGAPAMVSINVILVNQPPTANAGGPYGGNVGIPIQFNGTGSDPDGNPLTFSWNFGDGSTPLITGGGTPTHTYGATGIHTVTLTVTDAFGSSGVSQTTATIGAAFGLNPIGDKIVKLGETLTFTVSAISATGSASLFVAPLPLMTNATFNAATGVFTFRPSTTQVGSYQLNFSATAGSNFASETITIAVPNPSPGGTTAVRGKVVNLQNVPLSNVQVALRSSGHTGISDANGVFTITGVPSGTQQLIVNGRNANLGVFAIIAVAVELIDGVVNDLNSAISLPDVDVEAEVQVSAVFETVVTNPNLPGAMLEIAGGTAFNADGTLFTGKLSINPVPDYGRPESRPEELRPGMAVTIQPAGIRFNPPARITFPNADGVPPGNEFNLWSLSPDTGKFNIVGKSAVSADGLSVVTVEGGVTASAWHFPLAAATTSNSSQGSNFCGSCRVSVGSEANLEEGSLYISHNLPSYRSLGQSRSLSLSYSSVTTDPRPIVSLDSTLSVRAAVPNSFSTRLKVGGVQQGAEIHTNSSSLPEDADSTSRISVQFDASNLATGRYPFEATVFSNYLNSSVGGISAGNVIVFNRKSSAIGAGWAISDVQQLHGQSSGGILLTSGDGTALFFTGGPDAFTSPAREFSTLARNPGDGTYARNFKDGTRVNFDAQGLQTSVVDRNLNTATFTYDGSARLLSVTDPAGLVTTLTYSAGRLQNITDPAGRQTLFHHDSAGNLLRITDPDASYVSYLYDGKGHVTQATDELGQSTTYAYDFAGRFTQSTRPSGETRSLVATKVRGLVDTAAGQGTRTNPAPVVTSVNATAALTDGRGNQSRFALDALGQVTSQSDALGQTTATIRDANGLPTRIIRPNGAVTTMTYDPKGNLLTTTNPVGATTIFTYEPVFNQVKTIRDPKGNITTINYDVKGNPIEIIDALSNRTQMTYDTRGLLLLVTSAVGTAVQTTARFAYNGNGNLITTTNPKGDVTTLAYNSAGNVSTSTDAENRVTQFTYDIRNRLITVLDADLKTTQYGYDPKGNLIQVRDAKNQLTIFVYDAMDRLASAINPLGFTETFTYDSNGNLSSTTNRNGQIIAFNYDALNRLISKTRPPTSTETNSYVTNFAYDPVSNLLSVITPTTGVFNTYDAANRLASSSSTLESAFSTAVVPINVDTTINATNFQFEGQTLQVNGRTLTVNGQHTFSNVILMNGAILTHSPTTGTTLGKLDIVVTGTIQIDSTSRIDVSGRGFLGGGQTGNPSATNGMTVGFQSTNQSGTAGSYGGLGGGSFATNPVYGDFRNPNEVGSGGGGFQGAAAGNGGGLIRIIAQTIVLDGSIRADGGSATNFSAGGSGGGIRLDAGSLSGIGSVSANGSPASPLAGGGGGGGGRIAIYYQSAPTFNSTNLSAFGATFTGSSINGGAGTVYLQGPTREFGELVVDNNNLATPVASTTPISLSPGSDALPHSFESKSSRAGKTRQCADTFGNIGSRQRQ